MAFGSGFNPPSIGPPASRSSFDDDTMASYVEHGLTRGFRSKGRAATMGRPRKEERADFAIRFGQRLAKALDEVPITQAEAARRMDVSPARFSEYVRGVVLPPVSTIDRLISLLNLDPEILFPEWFADKP
jgi:hypothetical protein